VQQAETAELSPAQARKCVFAATLGCGLEFYDFLTFAFFAIQIGQTFFPSDSPYLSLMGSLATFAAGFAGRPLGAWILGGYGDRAGRKPAMMLSMTLMGLGIAVLALTPGYATIGIAAPLIAIAARFIQGFALGGEIGSATVFMVEAGGIARRGRAASYQGVCQGIAVTAGALVGLGLSLVMTEQELADYGWRIALMLGVTIVPVALLMRRSLPETHGTPEPVVAEDKPGPSFRQIVVLGLVLIGAGTIGTYITNYIATFGQTQLNLSVSKSMTGQLAANAMIIVASLIGGPLSDRFGRKPLLILPNLALALLMVPMFGWIVASRSLESLVVTGLVMSFLLSLSAGPLYAAIAESLPPNARSRGFSLIYSLPVAILGGTTQLFITWLLHVTGDPMAVAWYLTGVTFIGITAACLLPESAPRKRGWVPSAPGLHQASAGASVA